MDKTVKEYLKKKFGRYGEFDEKKFKDLSKLNTVAEKISDGEIKNVWLVGPIGTGKTTAAVYIIGKIAEKKVKGEAENYADKEKGKRIAMLSCMKEVEMFDTVELFTSIETHRFDPNFILPSPEIAVIDDFGYEPPSVYAAARFGSWINNRYMRRKINIITSNFTPSELIKKEVFAKSIDRLSESSESVILVFKGKSMRRTL